MALDRLLYRVELRGKSDWWRVAEFPDLAVAQEYCRLISYELNVTGRVASYSAQGVEAIHREIQEGSA